MTPERAALREIIREASLLCKDPDSADEIRARMLTPPFREKIERAGLVDALLALGFEVAKDNIVLFVVC
jgi:hypothetical protein